MTTAFREIGFWDYTAPGAGGGLETYQESDWDQLLDDMAAGGFNSLALGIKWMSTGYRSRLPWLDQDAAACTAIASDNALIHYALREARKRGIRTWLLVVGTQYKPASFGLEPTGGSWGEFGMYDLDGPEMAKRIEALFAEVAELFGAETDGIVAELESSDAEAPHRIPLYNEWAQANSRPDFSAIKNIVLEPRSYPFYDWRDFTTSRRVQMLNRIEHVVRRTGFQGALSTIVEVGNAPTILVGNTNLEAFKKGLPGWNVVTYDSNYDRRMNRLATMDFCIQTPHDLGFEVAWLTRGVMTFGANFSDMVMDLAEQWRMSLEDAIRFQPEILWFLGSDARVDGQVASCKKLPAWGYADGRSARRELMQMAKSMLR